jgi:branched-chain amino acid transport system substrate-binding protein
MNPKTLKMVMFVVGICLLMTTVSGNTVRANATDPQPAVVSAGTLKLAILVPLTEISFLGIPARDGALLAIAQQNAGGGILGMTLDPVVEDTACDATMAISATNKVITQDGVDYIIGDVCSSSSIPMSEIADAAGVIQMTPSATNPQVTVGADSQVKAHIFRACFTDPFQGAAAARFARITLSAQKAFIMLDPNNPYVKSLADAFQAEFSRSGAIVGKETYDSGDTDFSEILAKIQLAAPDVVYLPDYANMANLVTQQAKTLSITTPFIGGEGWDSPDLDPTAAGGSYFTNHMSFEDPRPEVAAFDQAFQVQYGYAPNTIAALAYDAAKLLFQAIQEAGTIDTAVVKAKLEGIAFQGVTGSFFFDSSHNPVKSAAVLRVQTDGPHFYALVPPTQPTADLTINYNSGSPGSSFTLVGSNYPPNTTGTTTINGHVVGTVAIDGTGGFFFQVDTATADEGLYYVTVTVNPSATSRFTLDAAAPLRPSESSGSVVAVPSGIAFTEAIFLPLVQR